MSSESFESSLKVWRGKKKKCESSAFPVKWLEQVDQASSVVENKISSRPVSEQLGKLIGVIRSFS